MKLNYAREVVKKLRDNGYESYLVGGCVRDMIMGIEPSDFDIATGARPDEVMKLFPRTESIGAKFGVVLVIHHGYSYEVATFRSDESYVDGRHPTKVVFTSSEEDVFRRDFTINGLLYDPVDDRVIDYVDGQADIERKVVRAIGDPYERFKEDKLRILRAIRFSARFGYSVEEKTWEAVQAMAPEIEQVSSERIRDELFRILLEGEAAKGIQMLEDSGLRAEVLPELEWDDHIKACIEEMRVPCEVDFAVAVLLHECEPDQARLITERLRLSKAEITYVDAVVRNQIYFGQIDTMSQSSLKRFLRIHRFRDHLELHRIHRVTKGESFDIFEFVKARLDEWSVQDLSPSPLISGRDLIMMGFEPGPSFQPILRVVEDEQLEGRLSDRESALDFIRERFK